MNSVYRYLQLTAIGLAAVAGPGAWGQTNNPPAAAAGATNVTALGTTTVVGHLNQAIATQIMPSLGATVSLKDDVQIQAIAQGANAPVNQVITRFPGVAQDSAENGDLHVRGEHANLQYRIDGVLLPEGIAGFGLELDPRFIQSIKLITGSLPAQYGFRTAGVVDIQSKNGALNPGGEISLYGGSYDTFRPSFEYGGSAGKFNYFVDGSYDHNDLGVENPTSASTAIHDETEQFKTFLYGSYVIDPSSRLTMMGSASYSDFQVPNTPGVASGTAPGGAAWSSAMTPANVPGYTGSFNSANDNENQNEENYYTVLTYQKSAGDLDFQVSAFGRESEQHFTPDPIGDLFLNGEASQVHRTLYSAGLQADSSYQWGNSHTLRTGGSFLATGDQNNTSTTVFNMAAGNPAATPLRNISDNYPLYGLFMGAYLQDEWKIASTLTLNYGARFDVYSSSFDAENQLSPRVNLVYQPFDGTTLHAGYSRYFTPPPVEAVSSGALSLFTGTSGASAVTLDSPVKAERANYYDVGINQTILPGWTVGLDGYYKTAQQQLDDGLFGQTLILSAFNYEKGRVYGLELTTSYQTNDFSVYANLAYSYAQGQNWDSAQFLFSPGDLAYVQNHWIYLDHDQRYTATAGVSYRFRESHEASTLTYLDLVTGSGLRQSGGGLEPAADGAGPIPNGATVPDYYEINLGAEQTFKVAHKQFLKVRLDIVNVTDNIYQLRSATGVGVNAAQYGMRRGLFGTLSYQF
ncbi:MAG: TonB-dependent receptor [Verrucomicrobiota bacterium]|jgi:outer membrane receptor protein involved in Fe transport